MTRDEIRALIGGYATGSLTEAEKNALFDAALEDQELFDELAREQELKAAIELPGARERLLRSLEPNPAKVWWRMPWAWAAAAAVVVVAGVLLWPTPRPLEVARVEAPKIENARPKVESPPPAPAPRATMRRAAPARKAKRGPQRSVGGLVAPEVREQKIESAKASPAATPMVPQGAAPLVAPPFAPQIRSLSARGAIGGALAGTFGFHYTVDWNRDVATVTADADGYLIVLGGSGDSMGYLFPRSDDHEHVLAGSTTRVVVTSDIPAILIEFAASAPDPNVWPATIPETKELSGARAVPNASPQSKVILRVLR